MTASAVTLTQALRGRYEIERLVGSGGMGAVFLATDLRHGRKVAIKAIRRDLVGILGPDRFIREISIVAQLTHPNIVPLHDSGTAGQDIYYVMPYIEGPTLRDRLRQAGSLPLAEAIGYALEIADGLSYAHAKGIVHRDIKPENMILGAGHAMIADFGVARAVQASSGELVTTGSLVIGTPAYMSPEQAAGLPSVDGRSDIYSLGLLLHEMLVGQLPSRSASGRPKRSGRREEDTPPGTARGLVPRAIRPVLDRAIALDPADRFATAGEFGAALRLAHHRTTRPWRRTALVIGGILVTVLAGELYRQARLGDSHRLDTRRIVVAPLVNRAGSAALDGIGQIAADWIIGGLQRTGLVDVVPTETAIEAAREVQARAPRDPVRGLAEETGAGTVVTGAYYRQADQVLLRIEVTDAVAGRILGAPEDVAALAADPVAGIVKLRNRLMGWFAFHFDDRLKGHEQPEEQPPTYEAYLAFSEAMTHYISTRNETAVPLFLRAYQLDSTFVLALVYASIGLTNLGQYQLADSVLEIGRPARERLSEYHRAWLDSRVAFLRGDNQAVLAAMRRAAELAPLSKAAYNHAVAAFQAGWLKEADQALRRLAPDQGPMRGFFPYWDLMGSIAHTRGDYGREAKLGAEAVRRYPGRMAAFVSLVRAMAARGDVSELKRTLREARNLPSDPIGWNYRLGYGALVTEAADELVAHGRREEGSRLYEDALTWYTTLPVSQADGTARAWILYRLGRWTAARQLADSLAAVDSTDPGVLGLRGLVAAHAGDSALALRISSELAGIHRPYQFGRPTLYRARIAAVLGQADSSVAILSRALAEGMAFDLSLHRDPDFAPIRAHKLFRALWN